MLEARSALDRHLQHGRFGAVSETPSLILSERPVGALVQIAGWRGSFERHAAPLMRRLGFHGIGDFATAQSAADAVAFRIAPERVLLDLASASTWDAIAPAIDQAATPTLDLSHARTVVRVEGRDAANLLARLLPIDFDDTVFGMGCFAQSGLHSAGVLVHRLSRPIPTYDIYIPSSYAVTVWGMIAESAVPFGYQVGASR
jgi:methylglutamate dehydrogenase subunit D